MAVVIDQVDLDVTDADTARRAAPQAPPARRPPRLDRHALLAALRREDARAARLKAD